MTETANTVKTTPATLKALSDTDKGQIKEGIGNGTLTYTAKP